MPELRDLRRHHFRVFRDVPTRWSDVDAFGHLNNAVHYMIFDTALSLWQMAATAVDVRTLPAIGLVVETSCQYYRELHFPGTITVGIGLERLGRTSVSYRLALFAEDSAAASDDAAPAAAGRFVEVYVDRDTRRPAPVPDEITAAVAVL